MVTVSVRSSQAALLRKHGLRPRKALGQHLLTDRRVLGRIVGAVQAHGVSHVVEMGAGAGALTFALLEAGLTVHAVELDEQMVALLQAELAEADVPAARARVQRGDLAQFDFAALVGDQPMLFVGNLPYQVTSLVLFGLLPALALPAARGAVVMVQAEVAARLTARPGGKEYGVLTVLLGARLSPRRLFTVRPGSFLPPPRVDSAVVQLTPRPDPVELGEAGVALVKELFAERRKQIGGLLRKRLGASEAEVVRMAAELGLDPHRRAETLELREFAALSRWLAGGERRG